MESIYIIKSNGNGKNGGSGFPDISLFGILLALLLALLAFVVCMPNARGPGVRGKAVRVKRAW